MVDSDGRGRRMQEGEGEREGGRGKGALFPSRESVNRTLMRVKSRAAAAADDQDCIVFEDVGKPALRVGATGERAAAAGRGSPQ